MPSGGVLVREPARKSVLVDRPAWHSHAPCRDSDPGEWIVERGGAISQLRRLRVVCGGCPVSGECLREGLDEDLYDRVRGPVRVGITGDRWQSVAELAAALGVETDDDHGVLAAWLLDGLVVWRRVGARRWVPSLVEDVAA
jgi:hypothetical protein